MRSRDRSKPLAAVGVVRNDPASRELVVKPAQGGNAALLWREGHRALMEAGTNGRCDPSVYAQDARRNRLVYGLPGESVEVDAIPTSTLREVVENAILSWIDPEQLRITKMVEEQELEGLRAMAAGWSA